MKGIFCDSYDQVKEKHKEYKEKKFLEIEKTKKKLRETWYSVFVPGKSFSDVIKVFSKKEDKNNLKKHERTK